MLVKELILKLKNCKPDWSVEFDLDYTVAPDDFYFDINKKRKLYTIYQGTMGT